MYAQRPRSFRTCAAIEPGPRAGSLSLLEDITLAFSSASCPVMAAAKTAVEISAAVLSTLTYLAVLRHITRLVVRYQLMPQRLRFSLLFAHAMLRS